MWAGVLASGMKALYAVPTLNGAVVATWKGQQRTTFDSKAFKADNPKLAEKYQKKIIVRTFNLKGK